MRGRLNPIVSLLALFLLAGCAGASGPERWKTLPVEQRATIFGTITAEMSISGPLTRYVLHFRNIDTGEEASLSANPGMDMSGNSALYERGKTLGWIFDMAMPAGRYEFFRYWAVASTGFGSTEYRSKQDFSLPFAVEAGKTYYMGEFRAYPNVGRNVFGLSVPHGGYFVIRDQQQRDTALVEKQRQAPLEGPVINLVLIPDETKTPLIRRFPLPPFDTATSSQK